MRIPFCLAERKLIFQGLTKLGLDGKVKVVLPDNAGLVEQTAAQTMLRLLEKAGINAQIIPESKATDKPRIILGSVTNSGLIRNMDSAAQLRLRDIPPEDDGYHARQVGRDIAIGGANARAVLHGVYAFEEYIRAGALGALDRRVIPYFRKRRSSVGHYFNHVNFVTEGLPEEKAEYLARLGVNQIVLIDLGHWPYGKLHTYVKSDIFPFQNPPVADLQAKLHAAGVVCKKYGLDAYLWMEEPAIPEVTGGIDQYPPEAIGQSKRPWGGDADGVSHTLCVSSKLVQEHYRQMMRKFVRKFSCIKGMVFYNLDGTCWLCTPGLCKNCDAQRVDSPAHIHNPWETQAAFVSLLANAAHEENQDFELSFWGSVHFHDSCEKLLAATQGYGSLCGNWNGSDRDVMIPDRCEPDSTFAISQKAAEKRNLPFFGMIEFNNLESIPYGLPYPFSVHDAIKRYRDWGVRNIMEFAGPIPGHNPVNAIAAREFMLNLDIDPEAYLRDLGRRQFGERAGERMYAAWKEMHAAFNVWDGYRLHPLCGSQAYLSLGLGFGIPPAILPSIAKDYEYNIAIRIKVEPFHEENYARLRGGQFLRDLERMGQHLHQAELFSQAAAEQASASDYVEICHYRGLSEGLGRHTCREYAELNHAAIAIAASLCLQRVNMVRAVHAINAIESKRAAGDASGAKAEEDSYLALIKADIVVQEKFASLLADLMGQRPCLSRTGFAPQALEEHLVHTQSKIGLLREHLSAK